eukprot:352850-Chlamydomonas_euryale.AAC.1
MAGDQLSADEIGPKSPSIRATSRLTSRSMCECVGDVDVQRVAARPLHDNHRWHALQQLPHPPVYPPFSLGLPLLNFWDGPPLHCPLSWSLACPTCLCTAVATQYSACPRSGLPGAALSAASRKQLSASRQ